MKIIISVLVACILLVGCSPIVKDMPDKQRYSDVKEQYDSLGSMSHDSLYEQCNSRFGELIDEFPASSYRDNAHYYRGRLLRNWARATNSYRSSDELLFIGIGYFNMIQSNEPFYNEALYWIAKSFNDLYELDEVEIEEVISAYEKAKSVSPQGSKSFEITIRLEELYNVQ